MRYLLIFVLSISFIRIDAQYQGPIEAITDGYGAIGEHNVSVINISNDYWILRDISNFLSYRCFEACSNHFLFARICICRYCFSILRPYDIWHLVVMPLFLHLINQLALIIPNVMPHLEMVL